MRILAIETSCDDTSAAVVENGRTVLALKTDTQTFHQLSYGGVVPEVASRTHLDNLPHVLQTVFQQAQLSSWTDIDAFAATMGPGLLGSLLVGVNTAKTLSWWTGKPFIGVHHLAGHLASTYLGTGFSPPYLALLVSGGHSQLLAVHDYTHIQLLGQTLDDAAGEAFDKVGRLLGVQGGAAVAQLAQSGDPKRYRMPIARTQQPYDFSFSGLKTYVLRLVEGLPAEQLETQKADIAAGFQQAVIEALLKKTWQAREALGFRQVALVGGVSANGYLRQRVQAYEAANPGVRVQVPNLRYCTDNAAMIAAAAYYTPLTVSRTTDVFSRGPIGVEAG